MLSSIRNTSPLPRASSPETNSTEQDKVRIFAELDGWKQRGELGESRDIAVHGIKDCYEGILPEKLDLSELNLRSLPDTLPPTVRSLSLSGNALTQLPANALPSGLRWLDLSRNALTQLPANALPPTLTCLYLNRNALTQLPDLPSSLEIIFASHNQLEHLPAHWPASMRMIDFTHNPFTKIYERWDAWADNATHNENRKDAVLALKKCFEQNGEKLDLSGLQLRNLPTFLPSARKLDVSDNELSQLPENLPDSILKIDSRKNALTKLPNKWPANLVKLVVNDNQLRHLSETLPGTLTDLRAADNQLDYLPKFLPDQLKYLEVSSNQLASLPNLPPFIQEISASFNRLAILPDRLPDTMAYIDVRDNRLIEFPLSILSILSQDCTANLMDNLFSDEILRRIKEFSISADYAGPVLEFDDLSEEDEDEEFNGYELVFPDIRSK